MLDAFSDLEDRGLSSFQQAEAESARDQLLDECAVQASREGEDELPLDTQRLDEMAADVAVEARQRSKVAQRRGNLPLSGMLDDLAARLTLADCGRCAKAGGADGPCGARVDHDLVGRRGECLSDIREIFDFSSKIGTELYSNAWSDDGPVDHIDLRLRTRVLAPGSTTTGYARLAGRTDFEYDGGRHRSIVSLSIDGLQYGAVERDAAAYYLIHEIVAHGFYDAFLSENRSHRDPFDLWAEGWMDCVAADLLTQALDGSAEPSGAPPRRLRANRLCIDVVNRCHAERYEPPPGAQSHRLNGMRLARKRYLAMRYRLKALDPTLTFNPMRSVQLACAIINANGAASDTVASINAAASAFVFGAKGNSALTTEELRFYAAVTAFVGHRDEAKLIGDLA